METQLLSVVLMFCWMQTHQMSKQQHKHSVTSSCSKEETGVDMSLHSPEEKQLLLCEFLVHLSCVYCSSRQRHSQSAGSVARQTPLRKTVCSQEMFELGCSESLMQRRQTSGGWCPASRAPADLQADENFQTRMFPSWIKHCTGGPEEATLTVLSPERPHHSDEFCLHIITMEGEGGIRAVPVQHVAGAQVLQGEQLRVCWSHSNIQTACLISHWHVCVLQAEAEEIPVCLIIRPPQHKAAYMTPVKHEVFSHGSPGPVHVNCVKRSFTRGSPFSFIFSEYIMWSCLLEGPDVIIGMFDCQSWISNSLNQKLFQWLKVCFLFHRLQILFFAFGLLWNDDGNIYGQRHRWTPVKHIWALV